MKSSFFPVLAALAVGYVVYEKSRGTVPKDIAPIGSPQPLRAGVRYLFLVRLDTVTDQHAADVLMTKNVENLEFSDASVPPFWASPGQPYSQRLASFFVAPAGNATITMGDPFYGIGRLERVVRLDGQPFAAPAPALEA